MADHSQHPSLNGLCTEVSDMIFEHLAQDSDLFTLRNLVLGGITTHFRNCYAQVFERFLMTETHMEYQKGVFEILPAMRGIIKLKSLENPVLEQFYAIDFEASWRFQMGLYNAAAPDVATDFDDYVGPYQEDINWKYDDEYLLARQIGREMYQEWEAGTRDTKPHLPILPWSFWTHKPLQKQIRYYLSRPIQEIWPAANENLYNLDWKRFPDLAHALRENDKSHRPMERVILHRKKSFFKSADRSLTESDCTSDAVLSTLHLKYEISVLADVIFTKHLTKLVKRIQKVFSIELACNYQPMDEELAQVKRALWQFQLYKHLVLDDRRDHGTTNADFKEFFSIPRIQAQLVCTIADDLVDLAASEFHTETGEQIPVDPGNWRSSGSFLIRSPLHCFRGEVEALYPKTRMRSEWGSPFSLFPTMDVTTFEENLPGDNKLGDPHGFGFGMFNRSRLRGIIQQIWHAVDPVRWEAMHELGYDP